MHGKFLLALHGPRCKLARLQSQITQEALGYTWASPQRLGKHVVSTRINCNKVQMQRGTSDCLESPLKEHLAKSTSFKEHSMKVQSK